jgi:cbb3-type cytochrome c oxidase subunit III
MTSRLMLLAFGMTLVIAAAPNGEAIFKEHCTHCHGEDGKGKLAVGKPDFTNAKTQDSLTDEEIIGTITNGRKKILMPAWKGRLSTEEISAVASYVALCR